MTVIDSPPGGAQVVPAPASPPGGPAPAPGGPPLFAAVWPSDIDRPRYYHFDDDYLIDRGPQVRHYDVDT